MVAGQHRSPVRGALVGTASMAMILAGGAVSPLAAQDGGSPAELGRMSAVFEEGGEEAPRCWRDEETDLIECKPTAVSAMSLPDGRVLFWNGIENDENVTITAVNELSPDSRNSESRVIDWTQQAAEGGPLFTTPSPADAGASNPNIEEGEDGTQDPLGVAGVPGRPGDGLVGSTVGQVVENDPSSPPDDPQDGDGDMFCSYQTTLLDGRVIVYGGTDWYNEPSADGSSDEEPTAVGGVELEGLRNTRAFDSTTDTWTQVGHMKYGRWYPTGVTLPDGRVTVFSGVTKLIKNTQLSNVRRTETFDPATSEWSENYEGMDSETSLPLYPRLHLMPNGKIFFAANGQQWTPMGQAADEATWALQKFWDPETSTWETIGLATLGWRSSALDVLLPMKAPYDEASVLMAGGILGPSPGTYAAAIPLSETYTVDREGNVTHAMTDPMNVSRWYGQGVLLPNGEVFAVNGANRDEVIAPGTEESIFETELFDPETGEWRLAADVDRGRTYHNSAVLLGDGRGLIGGQSPIPLNYTHHRDLMNNNDKDSSFQVFSPPYLFDADGTEAVRPEIRRAPAGITYDDRFQVNVDSPTDIESVMLLRQQGTTHVVDADQRGLYLEFEQNGAGLDVMAPPDGIAAPPGWYHLFVNREGDNGPVPSTAAIVQVGPSGEVTPGGSAQVVDYNSEAVANTGSTTPLEDTTLRTPGDCPACADDDAQGQADDTQSLPAADDTKSLPATDSVTSEEGATSDGAEGQEAALGSPAPGDGAAAPSTPDPGRADREPSDLARTAGTTLETQAAAVDGIGLLDEARTHAVLQLVASVLVAVTLLASTTHVRRRRRRVLIE